MPRSDSDILLKVLKLKFGEKEYEVPVLRMAAAAKWRQQFFERTREVGESLPQNFSGDPNDPSELRKAIQQGVFGSLLKFPEKIPEMVFLYAPDLPKDEILAAAESRVHDRTAVRRSVDDQKSRVRCGGRPLFSEITATPVWRVDASRW